MKISKIILGIASLAVISCSKERAETVSPDSGDNVAVNLTYSIDGKPKRQATFFDEGDRIGMYAFKHKEDPESAFMGVRQIDNKQFTITDGKLVADAPTYFPKYTDATDFYLYFPFTDLTIEPSSVYLSLITYEDQRDEQRFKLSDKMFARALNVEKSPVPIHFTFKRMMSKLTFRLKPGVGYGSLTDIEPAEILLKNIKNDGALNCITMAIEGVATPKDILPYGFFEADEWEGYVSGVEAIIPPQTATKGTTLFYVLLGDKKYKGLLSEKVSFESGRNYIFTMTVNRASTGDEIQIAPEVIDWTEGLIADGGVVEVNPDDDATTVTDYDGHEYRIVQIGTQKWLGENLKTIHLNDGTPIANLKDQADWDGAENSEQPAWCYYDNDPAKGVKCGALYNWYAAAQEKLCPDGWRVPAVNDWKVLADFLGVNSGVKLKSTSGWYDTHNETSPDYQGTDDYGFTALPVGNREYQSGFERIDMYGEWWTTTTHENASSAAYVYFVYAKYKDIRSIYHLKEQGHAIRCIQNK